MPVLPTPIRRRALLSLPLLLAARPLPAQPGEAVRLPRHISTPDPQLAYVRRIVELALNRGGSKLEIRPVDLDMAQGRTLVELAAGHAPIDVMWTMTDVQRESSGLLPVRIPIDRGLLGWRLLLVRRKELAQWQQVRDLKSLGQRMAGQRRRGQ